MEFIFKFLNNLFLFIIIDLIIHLARLDNAACQSTLGLLNKY